ncbi:unnamed protein product [Alopecurus aequalis]
MENKPSEHFSNRFETLKQNMLAHEATFRKQVSELHRLYKVQKNLMALQCRREELDGHSQGRSYPSSSGGIRRAQQVGRPVGHDMKNQYEYFIKGKNLARSLNGVSLRHSNRGSTKKMLDLQVPAEACADDSDDDVVMFWEKPAMSLPGNNGPVLGSNVKLNIEASSRMNKNWITGLQPSDVSTVNVLNIEVAGSSSSKRIDFPRVGASSSQNQCYSSATMNLNLQSLDEKHVGAASGSKFFAANEETSHSNSYSHTKDDRSNGKEWFTHKKNGVDSSTAHYLSSSSIINPQMFAVSSSNAAFKSQRQSSSTDYTARRHYADTEMHFAQGDRFPTFQDYCGLHSSEISGGVQYQKHSPLYDCPNDVILNNGLQYANTTLGQASENIPMEISWIRDKLLNMTKEDSMKKSQVPSSWENGHSQILPGSMAYSAGSTGVFGFKVSAAIEKNSQPSSTIHIGAGSTPLNKGEVNMEIQFHNKKDDTNVRNLIDLNVALPLMDDMETDARQSEAQGPADPFIDLNVAMPSVDDMVIDARQSADDTVPQEPDEPFTEAPAITDEKNLMVVHKDEMQAGSPGILNWFADLAISGGNRVVYNSESNKHGNSEALTLHLFETQYPLYSSTLSTQGRPTTTSSAAASTFNASYEANSSAAKPPKGHYGRQNGASYPSCTHNLRAYPTPPPPPPPQPPPHIQACSLGMTLSSLEL